MGKQFRLHLLIKQLLDRGMTAHGLARKINEINSHFSPSMKISRHTISRLYKTPEKASLTYGNLVALDRYFEAMGEGLADKPILQKEGLLAQLLEKKRLAFLVGSKPNKDRLHDDVSLWDFRSVIDLSQQMDAITTDWHHELVDVFLSDPRQNDYYMRHWYETIIQQDRSIIAIGAPRANLASEVMLAKMFGVAPFEPPASLDDYQRPFAFFWPAKPHAHTVPSSFAIPPNEVKKVVGTAYTEWVKHDADALWCNGRWHDSVRRRNGWFKYGILAAQRRKNHALWVVLAGLSGPATLAVAHMVKEVNCDIPSSEAPGSPVFWAVIKVPLHEEQKEGDRRAIGKPEFAGEPQIWRLPATDASHGRAGASQV